jgi:hypothetical protein
MERPAQVRTGATGTKTGTGSGVSLRSLPAGTFTTIEKLDCGGSLQARKLTGEAVQFYWRYSHEGRTFREPIGHYDPATPPKKREPALAGYSLAGARERCRLLADAPAADLTADDVLDMQRRLIEQGKGRTANKLRSYLHAAYQCSIDVQMSAALPVAFKAYAIHINPVAQTKRDPKFDRADKRPLSTAELKIYWQTIKNDDDEGSAPDRGHDGDRMGARRSRRRDRGLSTQAHPVRGGDAAGGERHQPRDSPTPSIARTHRCAGAALRRARLHAGEAPRAGSASCGD